ncbi:hypothetical protein BJY52DRAFT_1269625, partial [Lactarius psammicola]
RSPRATASKISRRWVTMEPRSLALTRSQSDTSVRANSSPFRRRSSVFRHKESFEGSTPSCKTTALASKVRLTSGPSYRRARHISSSPTIGDCSDVDSGDRFTLSLCCVPDVLPPEEKNSYRGTRYLGNPRVGGNSPFDSVSRVRRPWKARPLTQDARKDTLGSSSLHNPSRLTTTSRVYFSCSLALSLLNGCLVLASKIVRRELTQVSTRVMHASSESSRDVAHVMKCSLIRFRTYSLARSSGKLSATVDLKREWIYPGSPSKNSSMPISLKSLSVKSHFMA